MKSLKRMTFLVIAHITVYYVGAQALKSGGMTYRAWVNFLGEMVLIWILPLLGIIWTGVWLKKKSSWAGAAKIMLLVAEAVLYICWSYFGLLVFAFSLETEKVLTSNLLATNRGLGKPYYVCERPVFFIFKTPVALTEEDKVEYLREKYDRDFEIYDANGKVIYDTEFPEVVIHVRFSTDSGELGDDYVEGVLANCLTEGMEELDIDREYYISENFREYYGDFYIHLKDEGDIPGLAEDVSKLINYVCKRTTLFNENRGYLYFYCGEIKSLIPFDLLDRGDRAAADDYLDSEKLEGLIREKYETSVDYQRKIEEYEREQEELLKTQISQEAEEYIDPIETNAKIIYDAVLAEQGYSCEVCYNAKGNLYLNLGSRPAGEAGDQYNTGTYGFTLVYDRTSKNGTCELFVLYKEHYSEEGSDGAAILDMYAVEAGTGKVVAAGKQSWSDVGTKEYRELTGE